MGSNSTPKTETLIERIIGVSARNPLLVLIFTLAGVAAGIYSLTRIPLDAIPDQSDVQVIVYTDWEGRSPDLVEDQITYPISTKFIAAPKVKFVRGESMFGKSFVYVIFQDGTDIYWARSRVIEYLNSVRNSLPEGVSPVIGPDATGVGWDYEYALVDDTGKHNLAELRSFPAWRKSLPPAVSSRNIKSTSTRISSLPITSLCARWSTPSVIATRMLAARRLMFHRTNFSFEAEATSRTCKTSKTRFWQRRTVRLSTSKT